MGDFGQKIFIAVVSALLGGAIGFGTKVFLLEKENDNAIQEFARESQYDFLKEMHEERKHAYLEIEKARLTAFENPSSSNLENLLEKLSEIPFIGPRLPNNNMIRGFRNIVSDKLDTLSDEDAIKEFLRYEMDHYICVFDVNLQTLEGMMFRVATEEQVAEIRDLVTSEDLALLDLSCHK